MPFQALIREVSERLANKEDEKRAIISQMEAKEHMVPALKEELTKVGIQIEEIEKMWLLAKSYSNEA